MQSVRRVLQALTKPSVPPYVLLLLLLAVGLSTCSPLQKKTTVDLSEITSAAEEVNGAAAINWWSDLQCAPHSHVGG